MKISYEEHLHGYNWDMNDDEDLIRFSDHALLFKAKVELNRSKLSMCD